MLNFETDTSQTQGTPDSQPGTLIVDSLLITVRRMLSESGSHEEFVSSLFEFCNRTFHSLVARCEFQGGTEPRQLIHADERLGESAAIQLDRNCLQSTINKVRTESPTQPMIRRMTTDVGGKLAIVAVPLLNFRNGKLDGVMALVVSDEHGESAHVAARLDGIFSVMSAARETTAVSRIDREVAATQNLAEFESVDQLAFELTNSLCNKLNCEQASFGLENEQRIKLLAISGIAAFKPSSPGVAINRQAMEECLDAGRTVLHQADQQDEVHPIHRQWSNEAGGNCILSTPMMAGEKVVGVVSLRRPAERPFTDHECETIARMIQPYGSAVRLLERATLPLSKQIRRSAAATAKKNRTPLRLVVLAACAVGLLWFALGRMVYRPVCDSTVTSSQLIHFSAPFESMLKQVHVVNGQAVTKGTLLVEFDTQELRLELNALHAELSETQINSRQAMQSGDAAQSALHRAHEELLTAKANAIQERILKAKLVAPADGIVSNADLTRRVGQVFRQGEQVLSFAGGEDWIVEINIPDDVASHIANGQMGQFRAATRPDASFDFKLVEVEGSAAVVDGRNVFVARAELNGKPDWMRSGMKGFSTIETQEKPVWWVCSHRLINWFRINLWW